MILWLQGEKQIQKFPSPSACFCPLCCLTQQGLRPHSVNQTSAMIQAKSSLPK